MIGDDEFSNCDLFEPAFSICETGCLLSRPVVLLCEGTLLCLCSLSGSRFVQCHPPLVFSSPLHWCTGRSTCSRIDKSSYLTSADLHLHTLTPADLHLHTLTPADLDLHTLTPADLHLHTLTPADLDLHTLTSADLDLHTLTPADLHLHTLTPADLDLHTLTSAYLHLHTLTPADLDFHTLTSADLHLHTLTSADLHLHTFTSADLLSLFFLFSLKAGAVPPERHETQPFRTKWTLDVKN